MERWVNNKETVSERPGLGAGQGLRSPVSVPPVLYFRSDVRYAMGWVCTLISLRYRRLQICGGGFAVFGVKLYAKYELCYFLKRDDYSM